MYLIQLVYLVYKWYSEQILEMNIIENVLFWALGVLMLSHYRWENVHKQKSEQS